MKEERTDMRENYDMEYPAWWYNTIDTISTILAFVWEIVGYR